MKKQFQKGVLAVGILGLVAGMSGNALAASEDGLATAYIVKSLQLREHKKMAFGVFAAAATEDIVSLTPPLNPNPLPANYVPTGSCPVSVTDVVHFEDHNCGVFEVTGYENEGYIVTWDDDIVLQGTDDDNNGESMTADITLGGQSNRNLTSGRDWLQFGGSLNVAANQAEGGYSGTYNVNVNYQ